MWETASRNCPGPSPSPGRKGRGRNDDRRQVDTLTERLAEKDGIHIWWAIPDSIRDEAMQKSGKGILSPDDMERQKRFSSGTARRMHCLGRVLLRTALSRCEDVPPSAWKFRYTKHGRPEIASPDIDPPLRFSLSHTDGMILCAVARRLDVGIDVEKPSRPCRFERIAGRFFPEPEVRDIESLSPGERRRRFFEFWTLREACLKAGGWGLSLGPDKIAFLRISEETATVSFDPSLKEDPAQWRFRLIPFPPDHTAALAVRGTKAEDFRFLVHRVEEHFLRKSSD